MVNPTRGVLYPARLPEFHRLPATGAAAELAVWFWIPEWDIEPGRTSRQHVVGYPAVNLVVEPGAVTISGATTRASFRDLRGTSWAVGAMLRPAAVAALIDAPAALVDAERELDEPELHHAVVAAMGGGDGHRERAVAAFSAWLVARVGPLGGAERQANALVDALMGEGAAGTPEEAAARLAVSVRTLQRLAHRQLHHQVHEPVLGVLGELHHADDGVVPQRGQRFRLADEARARIRLRRRLHHLQRRHQALRQRGVDAVHGAHAPFAERLLDDPVADPVARSKH